MITIHIGNHLIKKFWISPENLKDAVAWFKAMENQSYHVLLEASHEELDYIRFHFLNLPIRKNAIAMIWEGEMARFILRNLV